MGDSRHKKTGDSEDKNLRLTLAEDARTGARIKVIGVGGGGSNAVNRMVAAGFEAPEIRGVYLGPVNWLERLAPRAISGALRKWEQVDRALADRPLLREFSNMFLVSARR